ncbi:MAG: divalent-cation tolerance protein CutA [Proteobacteria bacterium]|nr:divalent-cation tolerance protein CutA [Pseudomonadota bacterium]MCL2307588.1 divalent-cation tolerance protein CutA [Pseudomonadota bacterium]
MLIVHTSFPDQATAEALAQQLIEHRLAACVHVGAPIQAYYLWQGKVEAATEIPLIIKTSRVRYTALEHYLKAHHPYEVPEIVAIPVTKALPAYYGWVQRESEDALSSP